MISTALSFTSDYYSGSDLDHDDDDVVKAAPQHHHTYKQTNIILQTLLQHHHRHHPPSSLPSSVRLHHSLTLFKLSKENGLSDEIFIQANAILHDFLRSTSNSDVDDSMIIACLSLSTKLTQHSSHLALTLFNSDCLPMREEMICNALDWNINVTTPINYIEAALLFVDDCSKREHIRRLSHEMVVLCLTDDQCMDTCVASMGLGCVLLACEMVECDEMIRKQVYESVDCGEDAVCEASLIYIRSILMKILHR